MLCLLTAVLAFAEKDVEIYGPVSTHAMPSQGLYFEPTMRLLHSGVLAMLASAVKRAEDMDQPQCIVIVDASGEVLGEIRMTGAKFLSRKTALAKARTAASTNNASAAEIGRAHV